MMVDKVMDVCDGDFVIVQVDVQTHCNQCGYSIVSRAVIDGLCMHCISENIWSEIDAELPKSAAPSTEPEDE